MNNELRHKMIKLRVTDSDLNRTPQYHIMMLIHGIVDNSNMREQITTQYRHWLWGINRNEE